MNERDEDDRYDAMLSVAERHYVHGETMESIGRSLGVSRSTVSRLLSQARAEGLVRITLAERGSRSPLSLRLAREFGIRVHLVGVPDAVPPGARLDHVARRAAILLDQVVTDDCSLGIAWGVTMAQVARHLQRQPTSGVTVVQLNGGTNAHDSAVPYVGGILSTFAESFAARIVPFPVPAFFDRASTREVLWTESTVRRVLAELDTLDVIMFGVGSPRGAVPSRVYSAGYLDAATMAELERQGVVGDVCTVMIREDGTYADLQINARASGPTPERLRHIPRRMCVVADPQRASAALGALRTGVATDLICCEATARAVVRRMDGYAR